MWNIEGEKKTNLSFEYGIRIGLQLYIKHHIKIVTNVNLSYF